jgi:hypothetical protein
MEWSYFVCCKVHSVPWPCSLKLIVETCCEVAQCWEIGILTDLSSDSSHASCLWSSSFFLWVKALSCIMQLTKNVFSITECYALYVWLFVCLFEWLVDLHFISTEMRHLLCLQ